MDFALSEEQQAVADLADQILADRTTAETLRAVEDAGTWFDEETWAELARAGLTGIGLAPDVGGAGLDLVSVAKVHEMQGRHVAPLPLWCTSTAALAVDAFGTATQRQALLPGVSAGTRVLTVGLQEYLNDHLERPDTIAHDDGDGIRLTGTKIVVEHAEHASHAVVSATTTQGSGLFVVDLSHRSITAVAGESTRRQPLHALTFEDTPAEALGAAGDGSVTWLVERATALVCATQTGVVEQALRMTAAYTSEREQFGRPVATFQAVTQRLADQYIHARGVQLTTLAAVWELANDRHATPRLHIAKWFASQWAHELAHATQHVHGGMGVSIDYPLHRYTLWNKHLECSLGGPTDHLRHLGRQLAAG